MFTINKVQNEKRDRAPFRRSADRRRCRAVRIDEGLRSGRHGHGRRDPQLGREEGLRSARSYSCWRPGD